MTQETKTLSDIEKRDACALTQHNLDGNCIIEGKKYKWCITCPYYTEK